MKKDSGKKIRMTLDLTPQFYDRLQELERLVDAESKASVIRQALQLYEYIAKRTRDGHTFKAMSPAGEEETLVFIGPIPVGK